MRNTIEFNNTLFYSLPTLAKLLSVDKRTILSKLSERFIPYQQHPVTKRFLFPVEEVKKRYPELFQEQLVDSENLQHA